MPHKTSAINPPMLPAPTAVEVSNENEGITQIGDFKVCASGLAYITVKPRPPVDCQQVEIVKEFLKPCKRTRWARKLLSPVSSDLKHWIENWAGRYISTGAAIVAALELDLLCVATGKGSRNVFVGVHFDDVAARMAERGWYIARDHVTATRIQPPKPEPETDPEFFRKWAADHGIEFHDPEPDQKPDLAEIIGCAPPDPDDLPPTFWEDIADALGLSEAEEA
ncbi:hypothetical protein ACVWXL_004091 [Bradyrhizobium sp. GM22.5]